MKLTIKRFRVPVITEKRKFPIQVNPKSKAKKPRIRIEIKTVTDFGEVDLKNHLIDEEHKEIDGIFALNELATEVAEYNQRQLKFAEMDKTIITAYKKVVCKPTNTEK